MVSTRVSTLIDAAKSGIYGGSFRRISLASGEDRAMIGWLVNCIFVIAAVTIVVKTAPFQPLRQKVKQALRWKIQGRH